MLSPMKSAMVVVLTAVAMVTGLSGAESPLPNILWITSEDNGPHLGCYGDTYAQTPHLDALARKGMIYRYAWSTAPVCAPARTTLISGVYPPSTGSQHMRSMTRMPEYMKMYPQFLRELGYYCTNNSKEDYNLAKPGEVWDESSRRAHWKDRRPGQPFFAIFNHTISHESQLRNAIEPENRIHDPADAPVPPYHPDTPEVRRNWAQYYDRLTMMDARAGENLRELEEAGLMEETIIFYYGDHGSGMPRSKRWPYDSGLHVPLIVYVPPKFRHLAPEEYGVGGESERLVGFIDLAPTLLSIAGIEPPAWMQGHAFMGEFETEPQPFLYGFRGRMDERPDMVRVVRDQRYIYIRNYMPHRIYGQFINYMFQTQTTRKWKELYDAGQLNAAQSHFWEPKPSEELYDLQSDPYEVQNLAGRPEYAAIQKRLRNAQQDLAVKIRDLGFLPEPQIHGRTRMGSPYDMGHDDFRYPMTRVMKAAEMASDRSLPDAVPAMKKELRDEDSAVRYWGATGFLMRGSQAVRAGREDLREALEDPAPSVRVVAAEALGRFGEAEDLQPALDTLMELATIETQGVYISMLALNALDYLDEKAAGRLEAIQALPVNSPETPGRMGGYVPRLKEKILADLQSK